MDDIRQTAIDRFRTYLERQQFSAHTVANYTLDLRLFFAEVPVPGPDLLSRGRPVCGAPASPWPGVGDDQPATQCAEALFRLLPGAAVGTRESVKLSLCPAWASPAQSPPP